MSASAAARTEAEVLGLGPSPPHHSGYVVLTGRPNVGKSTLINRLVGQKIAITASIPQTTRSRLSGILTLPDAQIVFIDTPALHQPRHRLGAWMVEQTTRAIADADIVLVVLDAAAGLTSEDEAVVDRLSGGSSPVVAVLNKADRLDASGLATVERQVRGLRSFAGVVPVSALTGVNLSQLVQLLVGLLPEGPQYFPPETVTDQPEQFLVRELIREQAIQLTREELPYGIAVEIEEFALRPRPGSRPPRSGQAGDLVYVRAILHVERDSHKKMLIGRGGRMLKAIGQRARREIEALLGSHVYLDLWVKTSKGWRERDDLIKAFYPE